MKAGEFMKYTRLEIYKGISNSKIKIILVFFILIPVIAVLAGSIISKIFITSKQTISLSQNMDEPSIAAIQSSSYNYKVFLLQAGAFMSQKNAEVLKEAIKRDDITPVVIEDDEIYRVIINLSDDKELIIEEKNKLQTLGYNCLINEFIFVSIDEPDNEVIEKTNKYIKISADIIKLQLEINDSFFQKDTNRIEALKKYNVDLNNSYLKLEKINAVSILKAFKSNFEQFENDYIKGYENGDLNKCRQTTGQQVLLLNNYYKEVVQKIIK